MSHLFDAYVMVDWSAASKPKTGKDSIWIAEFSGDSGRFTFSNPPTRTAATEELERRLAALTSSGKRVLLGFDFSLGYPAGTADALGLAGTAWQAMHKHLFTTIEDGDDNSNNRFDVADQLNKSISGRDEPFWGITSRRHASACLSGKKPSIDSLPEFRLVERYLRDQKLGAPKSVWQLAYIGSVGSQSLMGIPRVSALRDRFPSAKLLAF